MSTLSAKMKTWPDLADSLRQDRRSGKQIVFTNGCFDILHAGHVRYLAAAKAEGDILVVGLNSDASVRMIKGARRPIVSQEQRAEVLAAVGSVDYVTCFEEPDPLKLIQRITPHVLVKGGDWAETDIVGADWVKAAGGRVVRVAVLPEVSTSRIIAAIVRRHC